MDYPKRGSLRERKELNTNKRKSSSLGRKQEKELDKAW